jgi:hypothetical protein
MKCIVFACQCGLFFLVFIARSQSVFAAQPLDVHVDNFPDTQQVRGTVSVEGPISHSTYVKKEGIVVPISRRGELAEMSHAGIIDTAGFTSISVSLQGEIKSNSFTTGTIGVILVPDEEPILRALRESKHIQFPLESVAQIKSGGSSFFSSDAVLHRIAFPRYRMYLYNSLNRTAEANVYLHLSQ